MKQPKTPHLQEAEPKVKPEVNAKVIQQFNFLQKNLGNQKVQELVSNGTLTSPYIQREQLDLNRKRLDEKEAKQIAKDRKALNPEINKYLVKNEDKLADMYRKNSKGTIYINVFTQRHYVTPPGEDTELTFYHYTSLENVDFSFNNLNRVGDSLPETRGHAVPVIDSVIYHPPEELMEQQEEEPEPQEETEESENMDSETMGNDEQEA